MKKLILALFASGSVLAANAQAGSILLYGDASVDVPSNGLATTTWSFSPGIGYQFNKNWTVGVNLSWGQNPTGRDTSGVYVANNYKFGLFGRYTHNISNVFYCYTQLNINYMGGYRTPGDHPADMKYTGFGADLMPAIGINVGKGWGVNFAIGGLSFSSTKADGASESATNFSLMFGKAYTVGISKNFGGRSNHGHNEPGTELRHMDTKDE